MALLDSWSQQNADETNELDLLVAEELARLKLLNLTHEELSQHAAEIAVLADGAEKLHAYTKDRLDEYRLAFDENGLTLAKEVKALSERLKIGEDEQRITRMIELRIMFGDGVELQKKAHARNAANARHSKPGGSREKKRQMCALWASGKYSTRDICAEQECAATGMSFSAARKALRGTPSPT